jgi:hypothetical protein
LPGWQNRLRPRPGIDFPCACTQSKYIAYLRGTPAFGVSICVNRHNFATPISGSELKSMGAFGKMPAEKRCAAATHCRATHPRCCRRVVQMLALFPYLRCGSN